jgi:hypothetical protein
MRPTKTLQANGQQAHQGKHRQGRQAVENLPAHLRAGREGGLYLAAQEQSAEQGVENHESQSGRDHILKELGCVILNEDLLPLMEDGNVPRMKALERHRSENQNRKFHGKNLLIVRMLTPIAR